MEFILEKLQRIGAILGVNCSTITEFLCYDVLARDGNVALTNITTEFLCYDFLLGTVYDSNTYGIAGYKD